MLLGTESDVVMAAYLAPRSVLSYFKELFRLLSGAIYAGIEHSVLSPVAPGADSVAVGSLDRCQRADNVVSGCLEGTSARFPACKWGFGCGAGGGLRPYAFARTPSGSIRICTDPTQICPVW